MPVLPFGVEQVVSEALDELDGGAEFVRRRPDYVANLFRPMAALALIQVRREGGRIFFLPEGGGGLFDAWRLNQSR